MTTFTCNFVMPYDTHKKLMISSYSSYFEQITEMDKQTAELVAPPKTSHAKRVRHSPTAVQSLNSQAAQQATCTANHRRARTVSSAMLHHGATPSNMEPAIFGLWLAFIHLAAINQLESLFQNSVKARQAIRRIVQKQKALFQVSKPNKVRSVGLLYSGQILSKRKYRRSYRSLVRCYSQTKKKQVAIEVMEGVHVDKPLSYDSLIRFIKTVNIGSLHPLPSLPGKSGPGFQGARRSLEELLVMMARRALSVPHLRQELKWFNGEEGHFLYALGGDAAPIDKANDLSMIMVSLLNSGKRTGSPTENFVLAAGNSGEQDEVWVQVIREAVQEAETVQGKNYEICGLTCRFTPRLVPCDMKCLAHFAGELTNAATYFSTFANVDMLSIEQLNATYSLDHCDDATFHTWSWEKRVADAEAVESFLTTRPDDMTDKRRHEEVLSYLKDTLKSRQIRQPPLGKLVLSATADPLHLMNNAWEHLLSCLNQNYLNRESHQS